MRGIDASGRLHVEFDAGKMTAGFQAAVQALIAQGQVAPKTTAA